MIQTQGSPHAYISFLKERKQNFQVRKTSGTTIVTNSSGAKRMYYKDEALDKSDFAFMNRLRLEIKESKCYKELQEAIDSQGQGTDRNAHTIMLKRSKMENIITFGISSIAPRYFDFSDSVGDMEIELGCCYNYENILECDITKAYYYAAKELGVIGNSLFKECLALPKRKRLRIMGSIATTVTTYEYEKGKIRDCFVMNNKYLRSLWFSICRYVDQCMIDVKNVLGSDFIFYWVDGIYFKQGKSVDKRIKLIGTIMQSYGFDYGIESVKNMYVENIDGEMSMNVEKYSGENPIFMIPKNKIRGYYLGNPVEGFAMEGEKMYMEG